MIEIRNNIRYRRAQISETCEDKVEVCAVEILVRGRTPHFGLVLHPSNIGFIRTCEWERFFSQFQDKILFGGDFNSHNII